MSRGAAHAVLELRDVSVSVASADRDRAALVRDVNLRIECGSITGLTGPSGSGKTTLARAILNILPPGLQRTGDVCVTPRRGSRTHCPIAYVDQDPGATLNPVRRVGTQVTEVLRRNLAVSRREARGQAHQLFQRLDLPSHLLDAYPHEMSGGEQQRAAIARAIACDPAVIVADEPGSALDIVTQLEVIETLSMWRRQHGFGVLLISHDPSLIHHLCDRVLRMDRGSISDEPMRVSGSERCA